MNQENHAEQQARAQISSICEMVAALQCDYERLQELREQAEGCKYSAGFNMPGYMPDSEPAEFDDADDARSYIAEEMRRSAEQAEEQADSISDADDYEETARKGSSPRAALRAQAEELREMADRLDDLSTEGPGAEFGATIGEWHYWIATAPALDDDEAEELRQLEEAAGDCDDEEQARERIEQDPLSVEIRSGWQTPGEAFEAAEFCILLCTGGPAVRIVGDLDQGRPSRPRLQYQDWGTPWTEYFPESSKREALQTYCEQFFFGE